MDRARSVGLLVAAVAAGIGIAYVDSRPTWDDTGITVGTLLLVCGALGALAPRRPWVWGLAVGAWIPIVEIAARAGAGAPNYGALIALGVALAGAYGGAFTRRLALPPRTA